ncbi:type II secretion system F family protein [Allorhodopirellula solitaria]|nr:type II secretion system F family protein [Allorhodopirellula solitaria]
MKQHEDTMPSSWTIAQQAEVELWTRGRESTRRRLSGAVTGSFLYIVAALAVGAYLILAVAAVADGSTTITGWNWGLDEREIDLDWMRQIAWGYAGLAILAVIVYPLTRLLVSGKLPPVLASIMRCLPGIGRTMRTVELGEFCQSMYRSVAHSKTYGEAFSEASRELQDASMRRWSAQAAEDIEAGQSIADVLRSSPITDLPLPVVLAFVDGQHSHRESLRVWHEAARDCHLHAQRQLKRTTQVVSFSCLFVSVFLAALGLLLAATITNMVLQGWVGMYSWHHSGPDWTEKLVESELLFLPASVGILLLAGTVGAIERNLTGLAWLRSRRLMILLLWFIKWSLWILGTLALLVALPHPITLVMVAIFFTSIVVANRWRYREETESLNHWLRLAAGTTVSIPDLVDHMGDGFHGKMTGQAKRFASRVRLGQSIELAVRRSGLPVHADTLAALMTPSGKLPAGSATASAERAASTPDLADRDFADRNIADRDTTPQRVNSSIESPSMVSEQFVYVVATILLAWAIGWMVRSLSMPIFGKLLEEFSPHQDVSSWGLETTVLIGNVVVILLVVWLVAAFLIRRLPLWMVAWVPWFGRRSIDRWRCEVLGAVARGVRRRQPAGDIFRFACETTRVRWIRNRCSKANKLSEQGTGLAATLRGAKLISADEQAWLSSAEKNGVFADTLDQVIANIRRRQSLRWKARKSWVVPLATFGVGIYVLVHGVVVVRALRILISGVS